MSEVGEAALDEAGDFGCVRMDSPEHLVGIGRTHLLGELGRAKAEHVLDLGSARQASIMASNLRDSSRVHSR